MRGVLGIVVNRLFGNLNFRIHAEFVAGVGISIEVREVHCWSRPPESDALF